MLQSQQVNMICLNMTCNQATQLRPCYNSYHRHGLLLMLDTRQSYTIKQWGSVALNGGQLLSMGVRRVLCGSRLAMRTTAPKQ